MILSQKHTKIPADNYQEMDVSYFIKEMMFSLETEGNLEKLKTIINVKLFIPFY